MADRIVIEVRKPATNNRSERALWRWLLKDTVRRPELGDDNVLARGSARTESSAYAIAREVAVTYRAHLADEENATALLAAKQAIAAYTNVPAVMPTLLRICMALAKDGWTCSQADPAGRLVFGKAGRSVHVSQSLVADAPVRIACGIYNEEYPC